MDFYFASYWDPYRQEGFYVDKQDLLNKMYNAIYEMRSVYTTVNSDVESFNKSIDEFYVKHGNTSAMNKLDKASNLLAQARSAYSTAKYICEMNSYLHPMADEILSEDISTAILKQNYMFHSFTIQYNCNQAETTIIEKAEEAIQKAQALYNKVLNEYYIEYS